MTDLIFNRIKELLIEEGWTPPIEANRAAFWWMNDNYTFVKLRGNDLPAIVDHARWQQQRDPYGALCPVTVLAGDKELRRVGEMVHGEGTGTVYEGGEIAIGFKPSALRAWVGAVENDSDVMRLIKEGKID